AYHHGHYDGVEREFRGFGMVEQWDTEELAALSPGGELGYGDNFDAASHVPPVRTRTWFHTGVHRRGEAVSRQFAREYFRPASQSDADFEASLLPDTVLPPGLSVDEEREACRALKGSILRQEVYAEDGSPKAGIPYTVSERSYTIEPLQRRADNRYGVFFVHPRETINYHHERNPHDPRVTHELVLEVDDFSNVLRQATIGYGRRPEAAAAAGLEPRDQEMQTRLLCTSVENEYTNFIDDVDAYRGRMPCEARTYELTGLAVAPGMRLSFEEMDRAVRSALSLSYEETPRGGLEKRLIEHQRTLYRRDDLDGPLPRGRIEPMAVPFESYQLALTPGLIARVYGYRANDEMLHEGGYVHSEGDASWWIPSGRVFFSPGSDDTPAEELAHARQHFFVPCRARDPFGNTSTVTYDVYDLLMVETRDPLGNTVTAGERDPAGALMVHGNDYRVLQPCVVMDPNRNRAAVAFDALGMVVGTAVMGKPEERLGDSLEGFEPDPAEATIVAHLEEPLARPHDILGRATTRLVYDLFAYQRSQIADGDVQPQPAVVYTLARETHDADLAPGQQTKIQHGFSYSDGFGREIQKKMRAAPGPIVRGGPEVSPRWVGSGWTIFNNKGKPVRQYESFFSVTHQFEFAKKVGVSPILFYDPVERVVATLHPNHTYEKVVFDAWQQVTWDVNDTVLEMDPGNDPDVGSYIRRLPESDYLPTWYASRHDGAMGKLEQSAAAKTTVHARTPAVAHFDALGRAIVTVAHNRFVRKGETFEEFYTTRVQLDIEGNQRAIIDTKDRLVMLYDYDLIANRLHQASMDAGRRWKLGDIGGNPVYE
ncbi:MAG TPA: toxin TcdB middle/C-terminal domain-containing protein, partial [Haliangium sp.]|nr:toxin TcdB middle/C-terminal domain-containing protein [Haliangium sp.]